MFVCLFVLFCVIAERMAEGEGEGGYGCGCIEGEWWDGMGLGRRERGWDSCLFGEVVWWRRG